MRPNVVVESRAQNAPQLLSGSRLTRLAHLTHHAVGGRQPFHLSVGFISAKQSCALNATYRKKTTAADVLSFPLGQSVDGTLFGEILLCPDAVRIRGVLTGRTQKQEAERLFIHGMLHLFGWHHNTRRAAERMEKKEHRILSHATV